MLDFLKRWLNPRIETRSFANLQDTIALGNRSYTNIVVTPETALQSPAFFDAVTVLSSDLSSLPIFTYRKATEGRSKAETHPVYHLLKEQPNDLFVSVYALKKTLWTHVFTHGNGYLSIVRNGGGRPLGLVNVHPRRVKVETTDTGYAYLVDDDLVQPADLVHVRFHSDDGITGISPCRIGKTAIGLALALDRFASSFFGNGARPSGILVSDAPLSDQARANIAKSWSTEYGGAENTGKTPVLEAGLKYQAITIPADEAQFNETKVETLNDIARLFHLPPHRIRNLQRATWGNLSSESLSYVKDTLRPWTLALESELEMKLLSAAERQSVYIEHCFKELLRADDLTRHQVYQIGIQSGFYTRDEVREWENMNPLPATYDHGNQDNTGTVNPIGQ